MMQQHQNNNYPAETQTGANTFGCLVIGKLFYPRDGTPSFGSVNFSKGLEVIGDPSGNQNYIEIEASNFKEGKPILQFICNL